MKSCSELVVPAWPVQPPWRRYTEVNLSANGIRDTIRRLLTTFEIPEDRLQLFLREDRNA